MQSYEIQNYLKIIIVKIVGDRTSLCASYVICRYQTTEGLQLKKPFQNEHFCGLEIRRVLLRVRCKMQFSQTEA